MPVVDYLRRGHIGQRDFHASQGAGVRDGIIALGPVGGFDMLGSLLNLTTGCVKSRCYSMSLGFGSYKPALDS